MSFRRHMPWTGILFIPLMTVLLTTCGPAEKSALDSTATAAPRSAPEVLITIEKGNRKIRVAGVEYGKGIHKPTNVNWLDAGKGRRGLTIGPGVGKSRGVSMDSAGLNTIHIDASAQKRAITLVYGNYDEEPAEDSTKAASILPFTSAVRAGWECIWCQGEILVCGVDPQCEGAGADTTQSGNNPN